MNTLKEQLSIKINHLKNGLGLIYHHEQADLKRCYLVISAENLHEQTLREFICLTTNPALLVSENFLSQTGLSRHGFREEIPVKCTYSVEGIKNLLHYLNDGELNGGPDRLLMRAKNSAQILSDPSPEARLLEFMSNIDQADGVLLYGLLIDPNGAAAAEPPVIKELETRHITTEEIYKSRFLNPNLLHFTGITDVSLMNGAFKLHSYYSEIDRRYHWAFVTNNGSAEVPLVRIESECLTGHVFGSLLCDCGEQLSRGLSQIHQCGVGALVYLRQEGRGIGLQAKLEAYYLQQVHGLDTVDANLAVGMPEEARDYVIGAQILNHLGYDPIKLLTNNPAKVKGLARYGITVAEQVSHIIPPSDHNRKYLETKKNRMGHRM